MPDYRCPKHDRVFESFTDHRKPGAQKSTDGRFLAHPVDGHPDCPICQDEQVAAVTRVPVSRAAQGRSVVSNT